jgi:membrane protein implicated in regulation of membrane protease activity
VLIIVAVVLLLLLPGPWNIVAFIVVALLWLVELYGWNRTVRRRRRVVGAQTLIGDTAVVTTPCRPLGQVRLRGETWEARCERGAGEGETVRVIGRDKLTLIVEPAGAPEAAN